MRKGTMSGNRLRPRIARKRQRLPKTGNRTAAFLCICAGIVLLQGCGAPAAPYPPESYNIVWDSPSRNARESMPVGGGGIQLNAWCENGELLFYMGSTDSYMDHSHILGKLGRVRMSFSPNPFRNRFRQELRLKESEIVFTGDHGFELVLRTDVFRPVVHAEMKSEIPVEITAGYETWKLEHRYTKEGKILFSHRNAPDNPDLRKLIEDQKAEPFRDKIPDPIAGLTSGGLIDAEGFSPSGRDSGIYLGTPYRSIRLKTDRPREKAELRIVLRIAQDESQEAWETALHELVEQTKRTTESDRRKSREWWAAFWNRSHICINPSADPAEAARADTGTDTAAAAWQAGRNYQLFRYMLGCTRGARHPVLFNGGIFNTDNANGREPEYRNWQETEFMAQNQRLIYWPLLKTGDTDLMQPVFDMYRDLAELQKARARTYWDIEGGVYPEGLNIYGLHSVYQDPEIMTDCFGRCPPRKRTEYGHSGYIHLEHHYTSTLDFAYLLLEAARFGQEELQRQMPVIENAVRYFDNYYRKKRKERTGEELTETGKLELYPSSALELYAGARNPTDVVSGLHALVKGVLAFPREELTEEQYAYFSEVADRLPAIPVVSKAGRQVLPPAETWELEGSQSNMEFPQLYALFPFETHSFDNPERLEIAKNTWLYNAKGEAQKNYICWFQGGIFAAHLGLTREAASYALNKLLHPHGDRADPRTPDRRFPAFWDNPEFCHCPDMDHGGSAMIGLQEMLMQTPGRHIYLLPAWPSGWDCDFKLHAPYNTVVTGEVKGGKLTRLSVSPASRKKDVVVMNGY